MKIDTSNIEGSLKEIQRELGWTDEETLEALKWVTMPTVRPVVGVREFMESPHYMGTLKDDGTSIIYPKVMEELEIMNSGDYEEIVLTGGIGSAKTTCALYSTAYQLYLLSCYENPHDLFGLDPSSEIVFIFQSINAKAAKTVDYQRFRAMIEKSPYFRKYFPFNPELESELVFPKRVYVRPVSSLDTAAIGQNVFGGMLDEVNFMAVIQNSKSAIDGGTYDQATALYDSISKRRKSRFGYAGNMPGLLCLVSSKRYPGQFTDKKTEEANEQLRRTGKSSIYVYDKRTWEIKPDEYFMKERFNIFIGDESRKPRILTKGEEKKMSINDLPLVMEIPEDYRQDFNRDIMGSLRDIAGVSTLSLHPFIPDRESVVKCTRTDKTPFLRQTVDFVDTKLQIDSKQFYRPELDRFVHCDLALTGDSAGFAVGCVTGFTPMSRGAGHFEILPSIYIDALLEIKPPKGGEILIYKVREIVYAMKKLGLNVKWVSFDQFQSRDSMQLLKQAGYQVGYQSMDASTMPYDFLKNALYDGRISMPAHEKCKLELFALEKDTKKNRVDHPAYFSKDVSDALAGVVFGLTMRRESWAKHGVSLQHIPQSIVQAIAQKQQAKQVAVNA